MPRINFGNEIGQTGHVGSQPAAAIFSDDTSSAAGAPILAEIARQTGILDRLGCCLADRRDPARIDHGLAEMIGFRALMIVMGSLGSA